MEYKSNKKDDGSVELEVKLSRDEFKVYFERAFEEALGKVELKGFRKGQAPKEVAAPYVDQEKVFSQAAERAVKSSLKEINEEQEWILVTPPEVTLKEDKEGLTYEAKVVPFPKVELGEYKDLVAKINKETEEAVQEVKAGPEEVEKAVEWLLKSREEGEGDKKEEPAKLTDELAQKMGNFRNAQELKDNIKEGIVAEKKVREADKNRMRIIEEISKQTRINVPEVMIETMKETRKHELKHSLEANNSNLEEYAKKHYETEEKLDETLREKSEKELRAHLILDALAKKEGVKVEKEEVETEMNRLLNQVPEENRKKVNLQELYDYSYGKLKNEKVFKALENIKN